MENYILVTIPFAEDKAESWGMFHHKTTKEPLHFIWFSNMKGHQLESHNLYSHQTVPR